jgi:hypothetical protein
MEWGRHAPEDISGLTGQSCQPTAGPPRSPRPRRAGLSPGRGLEKLEGLGRAERP